MSRTPLTRIAIALACTLAGDQLAFAVPHRVSSAPPAPIGPSTAAPSVSRDFDIAPFDRAHTRGVTVFLHGMCSEPVDNCNYFGEGVSAHASWLLCPSAPVACGGRGHMWSGTASTRRAIDRTLDEIAQRAGGSVDTSQPGVLIGFSQGAYVARDLIRAWPGRFHAVAFIGANIDVSRAQLEAAGIHRAIFASGRDDMTRPVLRETARRLTREGFAAQFLDLGAVGHTYVPGTGSPGWSAALAWLEEA